MFKRTLTLFVSVLILAVCVMVCNAEGYDDSNTNSDNTITDTVNWLASDVYEIDEKFVTNVIEGTKVSDFKKNFRNYENKVFVNADDAAYVSTGLLVNHLVSGEKLTVVVNGDINKDGKVNVTDITALSSHINGTSILKADSAEFTAADYGSNGKATVVDLVNIKKYIMGE